MGGGGGGGGGRVSEADRIPQLFIGCYYKHTRGVQYIVTRATRDVSYAVQTCSTVPVYCAGHVLCGAGLPAASRPRTRAGRTLQGGST